MSEDLDAIDGEVEWRIGTDVSVFGVGGYDDGTDFGDAYFQQSGISSADW